VGGGIQQRKDSSVFHCRQLHHLPLVLDGFRFLVSSFRGDTCSFCHDDIFVEATNDKRSSLCASSSSSSSCSSSKVEVLVPGLRRSRLESKRIVGSHP